MSITERRDSNCSATECHIISMKLLYDAKYAVTVGKIVIIFMVSFKLVTRTLRSKSEVILNMHPDLPTTPGFNFLDSGIFAKRNCQQDPNKLINICIDTITCKFSHKSFAVRVSLVGI